MATGGGERVRDAYGSGRTSAQRRVIARVADDSPRAFTAEDLAAAVRAEQEGIGLATVYRAVAAMERAGYLEAVGSRNGAVLYARCRHAGHHHHVVCTGCGLVSDTECPVALQPAPMPGGFTVTGHALTLFGLCPACQGSPPREAVS